MSPFAARLAEQFAATHAIGPEGLTDDSAIASPPFREAAVLVAITSGTRPGILLTERPHSMASHAGQVSFPGGKWEAGEDAIAAALREAEEELAVPRDAVRIIGQVAPFNTGSGYRLTPVLGVIPADLSLRPDPREVDDWFEAPLDFLLDRRNHVAREGLFRGQRRPYFEMHWEGHRIWGITAGILRHLSHRLAWDIPHND